MKLTVGGQPTLSSLPKDSVAGKEWEQQLTRRRGGLHRSRSGNNANKVTINGYLIVPAVFYIHRFASWRWAPPRSMGIKKVERESQLYSILTAARPRISLSLDDGEMLTVGNWRMQLLAELTIERSEEG